MTVTALLVSHDGGQWLPEVLEALARQTHPPERTVAVDTGSSDDSPRLLEEALGAGCLRVADAATSFGAAVSLGLAATVPGPPSEVDGPGWVWLLHDDSAPAPDALQTLLTAVSEDPAVVAVGPKLREWPSLRRLLEVGVTISGTGRRETGLERGEYDQGQHDRVRDVLAVNTAGMLVRRDVLERLGGFDERLPLFGNDIDLGWRVARAGYRTRVVPDAVVFHVEAAHRGLRAGRFTSARFRRRERQAALYTLLVNCSLWVLPVQALRLVAGSLLRSLGLLLLRAPREAGDELAALVLTYLRPDRVLGGRLRRRRGHGVGAKRVRHLLPPVWVPYRHGVDLVVDVVSATLGRDGEGQRRHGTHQAEAEPGPVSPEVENLPADTGLVYRVVSNPTALVMTVLFLLAVVGSRSVLGAGMLSGGALLPAPAGASGWWHTYLESWHLQGIGSGAPAPPYLLPLALLAGVLLGKAWLVVDLLFLLAVPLSALAAHRFLLPVTGSRTASLWGAVGYGLVPVLGGAVNQGRVGTVAAAVVLPLLARSATFLGPTHSPDRRWRAGWRCGLWLALLAAFVPLAWPGAVVLAVVLLGAGLVRRDRGWRPRAGWGPVVVALAAVPVLLLPWSLLGLLHGRGVAAWMFEAGRPTALGAGDLGAWGLLSARVSGLGSAPGWLSLGVVVVAAAALLRADTRRRVLIPWLVLALALLAAALTGDRNVEIAGVTRPLWPGFFLLLAQGAGLTAAAMAAPGVSRQVAGSSFSWRQPVALAAVAVAVATPVAGLLWWAATGVSAPLERRPATQVPTYMAEAARSRPHTRGVLVLTGAEHDGFRYRLSRGQGPRLGDSATGPGRAEQVPLTRAVRELTTDPRPAAVSMLARFGIAYIYAPAPADRRLAGQLDGVSGLSKASAAAAHARAWRLDDSGGTSALRAPPDSPRPWLLVAQTAALLVAAVSAAPGRRARP